MTWIILMNYFYRKMTFLLVMYLKIHKKICFVIREKDLPIHYLNLDLITIATAHKDRQIGLELYGVTGL